MRISQVDPSHSRTPSCASNMLIQARPPSPSTATFNSDKRMTLARTASSSSMISSESRPRYVYLPPSFARRTSCLLTLDLTLPQHRFVPTQITRIGNIVHALATAAGFADKVDPLRPLEHLLLNQPMRTFIRPLACAGDILLVPAQDQQGMVKVALSWKVGLKAVKENYYMGVVKNKTYGKGRISRHVHLTISVLTCFPIYCLRRTQQRHLLHPGRPIREYLPLVST